MPSLTRDIEQLYQQLEQTEPRPITDIVEPYKRKTGTIHKKYSSGWKMKSANDPALPSGIEKGGIYVFWWLNNTAQCLNPLKGPICTRTYTLQGKQKTGTGESVDYHQIEININDSWLQRYERHIPLYAGKSADSLYKRIKLHLQINHQKYTGKTTADQLRRGMERLFKQHDSTSQLIVDHVGYSFISLHGEKEVVNRFYLEDYVIGKLMPLFNVDIER
jgi:hypothetical protein